MYEFRWYVEQWNKYDDHGYPERVTEKPVLQYRIKKNIEPYGICDTDWIEVETVYSEV